MKNHKLRGQTLAALAFALLVFGCSSSGETSGTSTSDSSGTGPEDCTKYVNDIDIRECEVRNQMRGF
jgi:hypothetical protein